MYRNTYKSFFLGTIGVSLILLILVGGILSSVHRVDAIGSSPNNPAFAWQDGPTPTPNAAATMTPILQSDLKILSGNVQRPNAITFYDDFLYTACSGDFTVYRLNSHTGDTITYIAGVQNTHTLYVEQGTDGPVVWVADFQRNALSYIQTEPRTLENIKQGLGSPWGLAPADDESFYVTQFATDDVVNIKRDGTLNVVATGFRNPTGIVVDGDYVYVGNNGSARRAIEYFELGAVPVGEQDLKPLVSGLQNVTTMVVGPDNWLYFAYSLGTRGIVGRVNPDTCRDKGGCINADVEIVLWSELSAPLAGLTIAPDMRLFVHTMFGSEIYWAQLPENLNPRILPS